jgi:outer membrane protein
MLFYQLEEMIVTVTKKFVTAAALCMASVASFAETKIAILDPQAAVLKTEYAKAKFEKVEKSADFAAAKAKLDGIAADSKALQEAYKKDGVTWSAEKKAESEKKLQSLQEDFQFNAKKLQTQQQAVAQQVMQELGPKAQEAVKQVVTAEKIGLVLSAQAAVHASPEYDITAKVTELLNKAK